MQRVLVGELTIDWYSGPLGARTSVLVASGRATFPHAAVKKVKITLTPRGIRLLKRAKQLQLSAHASFRPPGRHAVVASRRFTLTR